MSEIDLGYLRESWYLLETRQPLESEMPVREVPGVATAAGGVLLGVDPAGHREVLLPVQPMTTITEDRKSAGVQIRARDLVDRQGLRRFVAMVCLRPRLNESFTVLVSELLERVAGDPGHPESVCSDVLERWRELLEREPRQHSVEELAGLFAELTQLRELAAISRKALFAWMAPLGSRHDFISGSIDLEVKATRSHTGLTVTVNGLDQLDDTPATRLVLIVARLEQAAGGGESVSDVALAVQQLVDPVEFSSRLAAGGFLLDELHAYEDIRFRTLEIAAYTVEGAFPRLTRSNLQGGVLPNGLQEVWYRIDLTSAENWRILPDALPQLYQELIRGLQP